MRISRGPVVAAVYLLVRVVSAGQAETGGGNTRAFEISNASPLIESTRLLFKELIGRIKNPKLRDATLDAVFNPSPCVVHRAYVGDHAKELILQRLSDEGLLDSADGTSFPGGALDGVFPPLRNEGSRCPQAPQGFFAAPGSVGFAEHHAYPGGLAMHEIVAALDALALGRVYQQAYISDDKNGQPEVRPLGKSPDSGGSHLIDEDVLIAAAVWHDWTKVFVSQWNRDGTIFREFRFGGKGKSDNFGQPGSSKTQAHHVLAIAEAIARRLPPEVVVAVASAHGVPGPGNEYRVVNWIRAGAIIARVDPVARGLLYWDKKSSRLRISSFRSRTDPALAGGHLIPEYTMMQLSDSDYTFANPAIRDVEVLLTELAPEFGFNPSDAAAYNNRFRNVVMSWYSGERLHMIYTTSGMDGLRTALRLLRKRGII